MGPPLEAVHLFAIGVRCVRLKSLGVSAVVNRLQHLVSDGDQRVPIAGPCEEPREDEVVSGEREAMHARVGVMSVRGTAGRQESVIDSQADVPRHARNRKDAEESPILVRERIAALDEDLRDLRLSRLVLLIDGRIRAVVVPKHLEVQVISE